MPRLTQSDRHVDRPATDLAIAAFQKNESFIGKDVPVVRSRTRSNQFYNFNTGDLNRIEVRPRAPATRAHRAGFGLSTSTFTTARFSLGYDISDEENENYDVPLDPEGDGARYLALQFNLHTEDNLSGIIFAASWGVNLTGVAGVPGANEFKQWNETGSTPIEDIRAQKRAVLEKTGYEPNELWMGKAVWDTLVDHPSLIDRFKANGGGEGARSVMSRAALAQILEVEVIRVSKAIKNTAAEGQTASHSFIFGKAALLVYMNREPRPRVKEPSALYRFVWSGMAGGEEQGFRIKRYRDDSIDAVSMVGDNAFVNQITGSDFGVYFASAVA